jgi:hypothetical protein
MVFLELLSHVICWIEYLMLFRFFQLVDLLHPCNLNGYIVLPALSAHFILFPDGTAISQKLAIFIF